MSTSYQLIPTNHVPIKAWTHGVPFEAEAEAQLRRVARAAVRPQVGRRRCRTSTPASARPSAA